MINTQERSSINEKGDIIAHSLTSKAEAEAARIVAQARDLLEKQLESRRQEANGYYQRRLAEKESQLISERGRAVSECELKWKRALLETKEKQVEQAFKTALERLRTLGNEPNYIQLLRDLIIEAGTTIGGGELVAVMQHRDSSHALDANAVSRIIETKTGKHTTLAIEFTDRPSAGGVFVRSKDGRFIFDNSLDARLERSRRKLRVGVAGLLFSEKA